MQPGPTPLFLPTLCPAGLPGIPPKKGQSRAEVTCDQELWEKWEGETWECSALQEGNRRSWCSIRPCARFATMRWDIAQGQYFPLLREMGESSQPLRWVSPWREPAGLLWKCIWNHNPICIMWTLFHGAMQIYPKPTQSIEESTELQTLLLTPTCPFKITFPLHLWEKASLLSLQWLCGPQNWLFVPQILLLSGVHPHPDNYPKIRPVSWFAGVLQAVGHREWWRGGGPAAVHQKLCCLWGTWDNQSISRLISWWPSDLLRTWTHVASCAWWKHHERGSGGAWDTVPSHQEKFRHLWIMKSCKLQA